MAGESGSGSGSKRSISARTHLGDGEGVVVAECGRVEYRPRGQVERRHRLCAQAGGETGPGMFELPDPPEAIDHAVVRPEDRVERREGKVAHVTANPDVDVAVEILQFAAELVVLPVFLDRVVDVGTGRQARAAPVRLADGRVEPGEPLRSFFG